jgi:hypothetical protein
MLSSLTSIGKARGKCVGQDLDHEIHIVVTQLLRRDAPQIELMRRPRMESINGIAPVRDARTDEEHVIAVIVGESSQRRGDHGAGVTPQHVIVIDVTGVAGVSSNRGWGKPQLVVVVGQGHDAWASSRADGTAPRRTQSRCGVIDEELEGVLALRRVGQVADCQVVRDLIRSKHGWHRNSFR